MVILTYQYVFEDVFKIKLPVTMMLSLSITNKNMSVEEGQDKKLTVCRMFILSLISYLIQSPSKYMHPRGKTISQFIYNLFAAKNKEICLGNAPSL